MIYITRSSNNRIKICDIEDKNFSVNTDYNFVFSGKCSEHTMVLRGTYCGACVEFNFTENCDGSGDISIPRGVYCLEVISSLDQTVLFKHHQVRVQ